MTRDRALAAVIGACSLALFLPLARPLVSGRVFVYNDLAWFHLPMRFLYRQALAAGDSVLWTPAIFSGLYLHGEGQLGLFHPFHQLIYRAFSLQAAFNLELLASYPAAFAGMVWFLRRLRFALAPALFGAMLFAFSGFNLLHHHHLNMVAVVAHLPALLAAADWLLVETRPSRRASTAGRRVSDAARTKTTASTIPSAVERKAGDGTSITALRRINTVTAESSTAFPAVSSVSAIASATLSALALAARKRTTTNRA